MTFAWIAENWLSVIETIAIVGGLVFTARSLRADIRARRYQSLIAITERHFETWQQVYTKPELQRVLCVNLDLASDPITTEEKRFVEFLIFNLNLSFQGIEHGLFQSPEGLGADIQQFFSKPIPREVWRSSKPRLDRGFVAFVESNLKGSSSD